MKSVSTKTLHEKLWKLFSFYIRQRDKWTCYTCGKVGEGAEIHAGHFKHGVLDFDEMNIHAQCVSCNKWKSGKLDVYAENLIRDYGLKEFKALCQRASMALKGDKKTHEWYYSMIEKYER